MPRVKMPWSSVPSSPVQNSDTVADRKISALSRAEHPSNLGHSLPSSPSLSHALSQRQSSSTRINFQELEHQLILLQQALHKILNGGQLVGKYKSISGTEFIQVIAKQLKAAQIQALSNQYQLMLKRVEEKKQTICEELPRFNTRYAKYNEIYQNFLQTQSQIEHLCQNIKQLFARQDREPARRQARVVVKATAYVEKLFNRLLQSQQIKRLELQTKIERYHIADHNQGGESLTSDIAGQKKAVKNLLSQLQSDLNQTTIRIQSSDSETLNSQVYRLECIKQTIPIPIKDLSNAALISALHPLEPLLPQENDNICQPIQALIAREYMQTALSKIKKSEDLNKLYEVYQKVVELYNVLHQFRTQTHTARIQSSHTENLTDSGIMRQRARQSVDEVASAINHSRVNIVISREEIQHIQQLAAALKETIGKPPLRFTFIVSTTISSIELNDSFLANLSQLEVLANDPPKLKAKLLELESPPQNKSDLASSGRGRSVSLYESGNNFLTDSGSSHLKQQNFRGLDKLIHSDEFIQSFRRITLAILQFVNGFALESENEESQWCQPPFELLRAMMHYASFIKTDLSMLLEDFSAGIQQFTEHADQWIAQIGENQVGQTHTDDQAIQSQLQRQFSELSEIILELDSDPSSNQGSMLLRQQDDETYSHTLLMKATMRLQKYLKDLAGNLEQYKQEISAPVSAYPLESALSHIAEPSEQLLGCLPSCKDATLADVIRHASYDNASLIAAHHGTVEYDNVSAGLKRCWQHLLWNNTHFKIGFEHLKTIDFPGYQSLETLLEKLYTPCVTLYNQIKEKGRAIYDGVNPEENLVLLRSLLESTFTPLLSYLDQMKGSPTNLLGIPQQTIQAWYDDLQAVHLALQAHLLFEPEAQSNTGSFTPRRSNTIGFSARNARRALFRGVDQGRSMAQGAPLENGHADFPSQQPSAY